jgi:hypothetical protein
LSKNRYRTIKEASMYKYLFYENLQYCIYLDIQFFFSFLSRITLLIQDLDIKDLCTAPYSQYIHIFVVVKRYENLYSRLKIKINVETVSFFIGK